jgi:hypothetical protein
MKQKYTLRILPDRFAISRLSPDASIPEWATQGEFCSITRTMDELSIVCRQMSVPEGLPIESDWRAFQIVGKIPLELIGVISELSYLLANAEVSIFVISSYNTDYILVKQHQLEIASRALRFAGHTIETEG